MFVQCSNLSITLSNYTANSLSDNNVSLADNMLVNYVDYTEAYKVSDEFKKEDYAIANIPEYNF